jgi:thiamine-phosphate diphosphorylase
MVTPSVETADERDDLVTRIGAAARARVHLVQIRQPAMESRPLASLVERAVAVVRGTPTRILVNDRLDLALTCGAHGVHLRGSSMPADRVRRLTPAGFLVGRSVHALNEGIDVATTGGLDFLLFGTVFASRSKPSVVPAGPAALAALCAAVPLPVLAIGGMTPERLGTVRRAGAAGFAGIDFFSGCAVDDLESLVRRAAEAFGAPAVPS